MSGWWLTFPSELVNWDDYSQYMGKYKMFQSTNQMYNPREITRYTLLTNQWPYPLIIQHSHGSHSPVELVPFPHGTMVHLSI